MTRVRSIKNQYLGVNAHLHSFWQAVGGWSRFNTNHITDLLRALRPLLLPLGYDADIEPAHYPESDVTIYDLDRARARQPRGVAPAAGVAELVLPLPEGLFGEPLSTKEYSAIGVYEYIPGKLDRGEPIVWIELLSSANKPGGRDAQDYFDKRLAVLESGIVFVELDYLHESAPTLRGLPSYRTRRDEPAAAGARAYRIVVIDPRLGLRDGTVRVNQFDVDAPIPSATIPLSGTDALPFDFGPPYRKTCEETLYGLQLVDYGELPQRFDRYSDADRRRIALRMLATVVEAAAGRDLEGGPFPVRDDLTLDEALALLSEVKDRATSMGE